MGIMPAIIFALKEALSSLPNIEVVTLLFIVFTIYFRRRMYLVSVCFVLLEILIYGLHVWVIMYLYMWPVLITIVILTRKFASTIFYSIISGLFGLLFGAGCALVYIFTRGPGAALAWWIAGIPFDIVHCISNFIICLVLYKPLCLLMNRVVKPESL